MRHLTIRRPKELFGLLAAIAGSALLFAGVASSEPVPRFVFVEKFGYPT